MGKTLEKRLLLTMTVADLKAMCSKMFKIEVLAQLLTYRGETDTQEYQLDEEQRMLSFFSLKDGDKVFVKQK